MKNQKIINLLKDNQIILETENITRIAMSPLGHVIYFRIESEQNEPVNLLELLTNNIRTIHAEYQNGSICILCALDAENTLFQAVKHLLGYATLDEAVRDARHASETQVVYNVDGLYFIDDAFNFTGSERVATVDVEYKTLEVHYNGK